MEMFIVPFCSSISFETLLLAQEVAILEVGPGVEAHVYVSRQSFCGRSSPNGVG